MHDSIRDFLKRMSIKHPDVFRGDVLEYGSLNVNGSVRPYFKAATRYRGIDWRPGPDVDIVSIAHCFRPEEKVDTAISSSMLEHDPYWESSLRSMVHALKPGGSLIITAAGYGFMAHEMKAAPAGIDFPAGTYYRGMTIEDIVSRVFLFADFVETTTEEDPRKKDVRCFFYKKKQEEE